VTCDAVVSPANSFGFMDGGLDYALSERFGWSLQKRLQRQIQDRPMRELLVGEALVVATDDPKVPWLISAPTMRVPMQLRESINAYLAMKAILCAALAHRDEPLIRTVAIPGLGTGVGELNPATAARQMFMAYREVIQGRVAYPSGCGRAQQFHLALNPEEIRLWH
jgi:O-acetyl-ADP-ribose deacetylase (regulator of RNase III)